MEEGNWSNESDDRSLNGSEYVHVVRAIYKTAIPVMSVCFLISVITNALVLLSGKWLRKSMMSPNLRLCISLAAADSWTAAMMLCGLVLNSLLPILLGDKWNQYTSFGCISLSFELIRISAMLTSDWHLFALAVNHCWSILRPLRYKVFMTTTRCRFMVLLLWALPILVVVLSASITPGQGYLSWDCNSEFYYRLHPFRLTVFLLFTIPLIFTFLTYGFVLHRLWRIKPNGPQPYLRRCSKTATASASDERLRRKRKAVGTTMLIVGTYGISWFPLVLAFFTICPKGCFLSGSDFTPLTLTIIGVSVNSLVIVKLLLNPLIYALRIVEIRVAVSIMGVSCFGLRKRENGDKYRIPNTPLPSACFAYSFTTTSGKTVRMASNIQPHSRLHPTISRVSRTSETDLSLNSRHKNSVDNIRKESPLFRYSPTALKRMQFVEGDYEDDLSGTSLLKAVNFKGRRMNLEKLNFKRNNKSVQIKDSPTE